MPNPVARGLAGGRTMSIGVVTQAIDSPFYGAALRGIEEALGPHGLRPLFVSGHWDAAAEARCVEMLFARRVDGIIVLTGRLSDDALRDLRHPVAGGGDGPPTEGAGALRAELRQLRRRARLATRHLIQLGHRASPSSPATCEHPDSHERLNGYRAALEAAGIATTSGLVVHGEYHEVSGLLAVERLLNSGEPFTAIFAANDQMALGPPWACADAAARARRRVAGRLRRPADARSTPARR